MTYLEDHHTAAAEARRERDRLEQDRAETKNSLREAQSSLRVAEREDDEAATEDARREVNRLTTHLSDLEDNKIPAAKEAGRAATEQAVGEVLSGAGVSRPTSHAGYVQAQEDLHSLTSQRNQAVTDLASAEQELAEVKDQAVDESTGYGWRDVNDAQQAVDRLSHKITVLDRQVTDQRNTVAAQFQAACDQTRSELEELRLRKLAEQVAGYEQMVAGYADHAAAVAAAATDAGELGAHTLTDPADTGTVGPYLADKWYENARQQLANRPKRGQKG